MRLRQSLLAAGLVDELRLHGLPVVLGAGRRPLPEAGAPGASS
jgi:riboflavin biosynthesis pyrimidine reductase